MMSRDQSYRTFIAIELPIEIRHRIKEHIEQLRTAFPQVRASWSRENALHLTLKFLGDVPVSLIPALSGACSGAAHQTAPFEIIIKGCGTFPPHGKPKILWIGIDDPRALPVSSHASASPGKHPLLSLRDAIEDRCAAAGFAREPRGYHPHLTIARLREARDSRDLAEHHKQIGFSPLPFPVSELILFRSELSSQGAKHSVCGRYAIG